MVGLHILFSSLFYISKTVFKLRRLLIKGAKNCAGVLTNERKLSKNLQKSKWRKFKVWSQNPYSESESMGITYMLNLKYDTN